jgi:hypothetical protein
VEPPSRSAIINTAHTLGLGKGVWSGSKGRLEPRGAWDQRGNRRKGSRQARITNDNDRSYRRLITSTTVLRGAIVFTKNIFVKHLKFKAVATSCDPSTFMSHFEPFEVTVAIAAAVAAASASASRSDL